MFINLYPSVLINYFYFITYCPLNYQYFSHPITYSFLRKHPKEPQ